METGSIYNEKNSITEFILYSPNSTKASVHISSPDKNIVKMNKTDDGYFKVQTKYPPGTTYRFETDINGILPDPASRELSNGIHGDSVVCDYKKLASREIIYPNVSIENYIIYELHVGIFSDKGTFEDIMQKIPYLKELGITAVEIMPVAQFPGSRNWGYDGVYPYAVHTEYGGVEALRNLVDALHENSIAVILDVVYNHLGPEGNYLWAHQIYFTDRYKTPWGNAINYDGEHSDGVRNYIIENALYWYKYLDIDCLRLDAVHAIIDLSPSHIVNDISKAKNELSKITGKPYYLIAESDLNDISVLNETGMNCETQWCDDFHHSLHTLLTGESEEFYKDFGSIQDLKESYENGFVYRNKYSPNRKKTFGCETTGLSTSSFIVFSQNHDMTGNRACGERLSALVDFESLKLAACAVIFSPFIPMLFAGEEYGEKNPFLYFADHTDKNLAQQVREGRKKEFAEFMKDVEAPDPFKLETFNLSKLSFDLNNKQSKELFDLYKLLIALRKKSAISSIQLSDVQSELLSDLVLSVLMKCKTEKYIMLLSFSDDDETIAFDSNNYTLLLATGNYSITDKNILLKGKQALIFQKNKEVKT